MKANKEGQTWVDVRAMGRGFVLQREEHSIEHLQYVSTVFYAHPCSSGSLVLLPLLMLLVLLLVLLPLLMLLGQLHFELPLANNAICLSDVWHLERFPTGISDGWHLERLPTGLMQPTGNVE